MDRTKIHILTHSLLDELQHAFQECGEESIEARILSAIVSVRMVHDDVTPLGCSCSGIDPEEYCCAV